MEAKGVGVRAAGTGPGVVAVARLETVGDGACCAAAGADRGIASGRSPSWPGPPVLVPVGGAGVSSAGASGAAPGLPTGRIAAGRRTPAGPSAVAASLSGAVVGFLRGVNQPPPPPEVPLSADVVVGASMVCLASSIFRSVCALPQSEGACFPPWTVAFPSLSRPMRPHSTRTPAPYGQVRRECDIGRSNSHRASHSSGRFRRTSGNAGLRSLRPVRLRRPALGPHGTVVPSRMRTGVDPTGHRRAHKSPLASSRIRARGESSSPSTMGQEDPVQRLDRTLGVLTCFT